jgi:hypothetical protein
MNDSVLPRILALKSMPIAELKTMWRDLFNAEPPQFNRRFLQSRLAYRIQELSCGGLAAATIKHLEQLGKSLDGGNQKVRSRRADDRPIAGTRLIREFHGVAHEVTVGVDYFEYQGKRYSSLSSVAKSITGTPWNGWVFFGLRSTRSQA